MIASVDSSILVAALRTSERNHAECAAVLDQGGLHSYVHALAETFSILTGGHVTPRVSAAQAASLIEASVFTRTFTPPFYGPKVAASLRQRGLRAETAQ